MISILLILVLVAVTWCVASEGAGGAAITLLAILFSGLLAMNYFEPLALLLQDNISSSFSWKSRWDFIALLGLFAFFIGVIRFLAAKISPEYIHVHAYTYEAARWGCGLLAGYITMAFLFASLHTAPLPREFIGFKPENNKMLFGIVGPDRQWLGFTQYVSERVYPRTVSKKNKQGQFKMTKQIFDGRTRWQEGVAINKQTEDEIFSSFILRYATRREKLETGGVNSSNSGLQKVAPTTGGGGGGGF